MPADCNSSGFLRSLTRPTAKAAAEMRVFAEGVDDWGSLLMLAIEHRVAPALYRRLPELAGAIPLAIQERLRNEYNANTLRNFANAAELIRVLKEFDARSISAMPFKGVVLAASVYGDLAARAAGDIDVLIHYRDLAAAKAILQDRGFELTTPSNPDGTPAIPDYFEFHFERPGDGMVVELRW